MLRETIRKIVASPTGRTPIALLYPRFMVRRSSAVEQLTVNQLVVGSIPTAGAKTSRLSNGIASRRHAFVATKAF